MTSKPCKRKANCKCFQKVSDERKQNNICKSETGNKCRRDAKSTDQSRNYMAENPSCNNSRDHRSLSKKEGKRESFQCFRQHLGKGKTYECCTGKSCREYGQKVAEHKSCGDSLKCIAKQLKKRKCCKGGTGKGCRECIESGSSKGCRKSVQSSSEKSCRKSVQGSSEKSCRKGSKSAAYESSGNGVESAADKSCRKSCQSAADKSCRKSI